MSTSGPEALRALDEAVRDIRREEDEIARRLARSAELLTRLREQEGELLRQLVSARLDAAAQEQLARQASEAGARARQMLKAHGETLAAIDDQLTGLDAAIAAAVTERAALQGEAARLDGELTALAGAVRPQIEADPTYAAKVETARRLAGVADDARQRADAGAAACDSEARAYRGDPLFSYLWARGHGTGSYRANRFTAWLDSKIAARVGFDEKRPLFAALNDIPPRLRDVAVRQQSEAGAAGAAVRAFEADTLDAAGGTPARDGRAATVAGIGEIDGRVVILEDERDAAARRQLELAQGGDPEFTAAMAGLVSVIGRPDLRMLLAEARAAAGGQYGTIVQQIDDVRQRAKEESDEAREQRARLRTLASRRRDLEDIAYEVRQQGFDNPRSRFADDGLVGGLLNDFLRGGVDAPGYWAQWRNSQGWDTPEAAEAILTPVYGGPAGGWGRAAPPPAEAPLSRPRTRT